MSIKIPSRRLESTPIEDEPQLQAMALSPLPKTTDAEIVKSEDNSMLEMARQRTSTLQLTAEEIKQLTADFPDADFQRGAKGDQNLIYLEHKALRERLSKVIGLGAWRCKVRRTWAEDFKVLEKPNKPESTATRIYVDSVLLIRGVEVGEGVGDAVYYKSNAAQNYGDAYESAKTAAFRLCCKDFGIGLQAHSKDFCENWKLKYPGFERPTR